ncbi:MAG: murein L,D-transpeptidase catalytic domain-containing protein [Pseudobdellovibrionaceae bacterium]
MKILSIKLFALILSVSSLSYAESLFHRHLKDGRLLFDTLLQQGVPRPPLDLIFRMFDYNHGRIANTEYTVLVDYSLPSIEKRFFLINLKTAEVQRFYVSHGIRSGVIEARSFSNSLDSWKSSLGFYYAKGAFTSEKNGLSLYMDGIDSSNNNAKLRNIFLHGAKYVSEDFIAQNGRLGWSEGCFAVGLDYVNYLVEHLQKGSIIFAYHKDLMKYSRKSPYDQELSGTETIPSGVNNTRTPGEGGGSD